MSKVGHIYDCAVIGAGHNGLIHAAYLARAGLDVLVLERGERVGGATSSEEVPKGFHHSVFSYLVSLLRPEVIHELDLVRHGLRVIPLRSTLNPLADGDELYREADAQRTYRNIARHSRRDAEAYFEFKLRMSQVARAAHRLQETLADPRYVRELGVLPVGAPTASPSDDDALAELGEELLELPSDQLVSLLQMLTMSAADFLGQWFESDAVIAALSTSSIIGSFVSPRSPGSAYVLLHHYMGEVDGEYRAWGFQPGGTGAVAAALHRCAVSHGARVRTEAAVERLRIEGGRVAGVILDDGEEIRARAVSSSLDPRTSLLRLPEAPQQWLDDEELQRLRSWNSEGCSAKVNLALDRVPSFACRPQYGPHLAGGISIAPSVDYVERAYQQAKYGEFSQRPFLDMVLPSELDPDMAPPGAAVMSCFVQYAPRHLASGAWDSAAREALGDAVLEVLEEHMPGVSETVLHRQVLSPADIEERVGIDGGNIFHGELRFSQLFLNRPLVRASAFATPLPAYYLCGSGTHPGGGISGAPGRFAALRVARDLATGRDR